MKSFKSAQSSAMAEVKGLLELISDPKKMKEQLSMLEQEAADCMALAKSVEEKLLALAAQEENFKAQMKELEGLKAKAKELAEKEAAIQKRHASVSARESVLEKAGEEFAARNAKIEDAISAKMAAAHEKQMKADESLKVAMALKADYENKIAGLKAAIG